MNQSDVYIILASGSPRRRGLLAEAGYAFTVVPPENGTESAARIGETPSELVLRSACEKGMNVALRLGADDLKKRIAPSEKSCRRIIVACDTVAVCAGEILGKPRDRADARRMLKMLTGSEHEVLSGLFLLAESDDGFAGPQNVSLTRTTLFMDALSDEQITDYLDGGLWAGKAGAFGYQDGNQWVRILEGSASNVVGLPMERLAEELAKFQ